MFKKILVPLDGSQLAEAILPEVESLAKTFGAEVVLIRAHMPSAFQYFGSDPRIVTDTAHFEEVQSREYLDDMAAQLSKKGIAAKTLLNEGDAADVILDAAEATGADLIAMTTHGRTGVGRWLMGSVSNKVIHAARTPVLLSRGLARQEAQVANADECEVAINPSSVPNPGMVLPAFREVQ